MNKILSDISFEECKKEGYAARTWENVAKSDGTLAIALDFNTAGEKCTHRACETLGKPYLGLFYDTLLMPKSLNRAWNFMVENNITHLNGAGNGLYSLKGEDQFYASVQIYKLLNFLMSDRDEVRVLGLARKSESLVAVRSGGQTGIDEAFLHASRAHGLATHCLAPKGWIYRNGAGVDVYGEKPFKSRFL